MRALLILPFFLLACSGKAQPGWQSAPCEVKNGEFMLHLGWTKSPTYVGVVLPDGRWLRLRYAPDAIDTLGPGYAKGVLRVPLGVLVGVNSRLQQEQVFTQPGTYRFVMRDANTAEDLDLHRVDCRVTINSSQLSSPPP